MLVFIDESGDTGLDISRGATPFFGMCMVVFEDNIEALNCDRRIARLRRELGYEEDFEFHFHRNSNRIRRQFLHAVLPFQFYYYGIVINKAKLFGQGFKNKESFYKYACGLLFANAKERLVQATVIIDDSGRALFKYQLAQYLKRMLNTPPGQRVIHKVKMQDSHRNNLLQLADMIAGAIHRSYTATKTDRELYRSIVRSREISVHFWPN